MDINQKKYNVVVCSRDEFPDQVKRKPDWAYISISATPECAKFWLLDESESNHYLPSSDNTLNLEFDDLEEDKVWKGHTFKTITDNQAKELFTFIENHLDKNILIHCRAGRSISQGVFRFILDMYPDFYEECEENKLNPCKTPNMEVVRKLKRCWYEKNPFIFSEISEIDESFIGHYVVQWNVSKPKRSEIYFMIGLIDGIDDNFYVLINENLHFLFQSVCIGLKIVEFPPIDYMKDIDLSSFSERFWKYLRNFSDLGEDAKPIKLWEKVLD